MRVEKKDSFATEDAVKFTILPVYVPITCTLVCYIEKRLSIDTGLDKRDKRGTSVTKAIVDVLILPGDFLKSVLLLVRLKEALSI